MRAFLLMLFLSGLLSTSLSAIGLKDRLLHRSRYQVSLTNSAIGTPPHFMNGRLHPGFEAGLLTPLGKGHRKNTADAHLLFSYFSQASLQRSIGLKPGIGYRIRLYKELGLRPKLSLNLMAVQQLNEEFKFSGNGQYEKVNPWRLQFMPSLGLEAYHPLFTMKQRVVALTLGYEFGMQLPFSVISSLLPMSQLQIGLQTQLRSTTAKK